jgi:SAM-dependent methyltransferase
MWSVRVSRYLSPMDVFMDDQRLLTAIEKAWSLWPDRYGARPSSLRRILKTYPGAASVSNFRPTVSRALLAGFTGPGDMVLDFSSGYGGRMLGCLSLGREYVGIEPCPEQVRGSRQMFQTLRQMNLVETDATIHQGCAEDLLPRIPSHSASLVLSSPPYYDWERYSNSSTQSFLRYETYETWLSGFLAPAVKESRRILKPGSHLILNISGKCRLPERPDVERIAAAAGFILQAVLPMMLARIPYLHPRSAGAFKPELLLIFRTQ